MGSLSRVYDQQKRLGQVYTPPFIVDKLLGLIGFGGPHALGKTILDPACGDGRFLTEVARRTVHWSPCSELVANLSCLHGWDLDPDALQLCRRNLDAIAEEANVRVDWNLFCGDALHKRPGDSGERFDFVVGNPPYIRIQHLEAEQRRFIQTHYDFCRSGSTDIYLAFFELANALVKPGGLCAYITPNTYLFTQTGKVCRAFFAQSQTLRHLVNYGDIQLFENATTYSAITVWGTEPQTQFIYEKASGEPQNLDRRVVPSTSLKQPVWSLGGDTVATTGRKLGDICRIHVGITTLCDKAYIFPTKDAGDGFVWADTRLRGQVKLEAGILRPVVKGSTLKSSDDPITHSVLFPYERINGKHRIHSESCLQERYPLAYAYLQSVRPELDKRDNGEPNPVAWYAFGRQQSLDNSWGKKIIFSPMNNRPRFILHDHEDCTVYSGYFIKYDGDYTTLLDALNSDAMARFVEASSRDFRGAWKAYSKKIIENFVVNLE